MSPFPSIAPAFLEEMVVYLLHLFIRGAGGDEAAARHAALSTLAAYDPADEQELRLAAQIISFGFATLEALSRSMDPELSLNTVLRLRGNANAAHRSSHQLQRTLDKLRKERRIEAERAPAPETAGAAEPSRSTPQLSRQQRRELERKAAKAQRKQTERVRLDVKTAQRAAPPASSPPGQSQAPSLAA